VTYFTILASNRSSALLKSTSLSSVLLEVGSPGLVRVKLVSISTAPLSDTLEGQAPFCPFSARAVSTLARRFSRDAMPSAARAGAARKEMIANTIKAVLPSLRII